MRDLTPRSRGRRVALSLGVLLGLLAAVAIASTGDTPLGGGGVRPPSDRLTDVLVSLLLVLVVLGIPVLAVLLFFRRHAQVELERLGVRRKRGALGTATVLVAVGLLIAISLKIAADRTGEQPLRIPTVSTNPADGETGSQVLDEPYRPRFATAAVAVVLGVAAAAAAAALLSARARRRRLGDAQELALVLADVLEETLDDLRAEPDPRRAVIAAYARLERALAAYGLPRRPAEAPGEYLQRIFADLDVGRRSVERLTALFTQAKFSQHEIGPATKEEAIAALETVREELRTAEARAEAERAAALQAARERAAPS
jgi:hypothetical protein